MPKRQTMAPMMAELPVERLDTSTDFANVDYFGPFTIKTAEKKAMVVFLTCLPVRAVCIEIAPKLDSCSCLNAIMQFIAQRGKPIKMISDKGTNFVGADREFKEYAAAWNKE